MSQSISVTHPSRTVSKANPLRILLAEDGLVLQKVLLAQLKRLGHSAVPARNGLDAIERLYATPFDLVLMDLEMPEMDGLTATAVLRSELSPQVQPVVVALTAQDVTGIREELLEKGFDEALTKPIRLYPLTKLLVRVPRLLRTRRSSPTT